MNATFKSKPYDEGDAKMRYVLLTVIFVAVLAGCGGAKTQPAPSDRRGETDALLARLKAVEADVLATQKQIIAEQQKSEDLRRRLATIESRFEAAASMGITHETAPAAAPVGVASTPPGRRGGFTDFSSGLQPAGASTHDGTAAKQQHAQILTIGSTSSGITGDPAIIRHCTAKWGANYEMVEYCQKNQQSAKNTWERGSSAYNTNDAVFAGIRRGCSSKWGTNYEMLVYCEKNQVDAYNAISRR